jgi:sulfatase maturation enzyme AslB (radical SAM superfamily)
MDFSSFTLILTYDCNFNCTYCFQKKTKEYLDKKTLIRILEFFFPFFNQEFFINFYGGEPLLAFDRIAHFSITTNGSRMDSHVLKFLDRNNFSVLLSFDGIIQDDCRKRGSFDKLSMLVDGIHAYPNISFETNSVYTAETVDQLARSTQFMIESGISHINLSLSTLPPWDDSALGRLKEELSILRSFLKKYFKKKEKIPVDIFTKTPGKKVFGCSAGQDRMAISPDGRLWGCCFFSDLCRALPERKELNRYCFGALDSFIKNHEETYPKVLSNYEFLRMDHFHTIQQNCMECENLFDCAVCPVDAALGSKVIRLIPVWVCSIRKIILEERRRFLDERSSRS